MADKVQGMYFPKALEPGACVGLIAPASPVSHQERVQCEAKLWELGFSVVTGEALGRDENRYGYLAGSAKARAEDLNRMFADERVEAVFCVRGGYGSAQILKYLDYASIRRNPKIFVGYSDITALHSVLQRYCGLVTFHGPMVRPNLLPEPDAYTLENLMAACSMEDFLEYVSPVGEETYVIREGCAQGVLVGGNLSVLARSLGTFYAPITDEKILFLEDVGECIPRIHMYLTQMKEAGIFHNVAGVLLGDFTDCTNQGYDESLTVKDFLHIWFSQLKVPVIGNICSDHRRPMATLPFGAVCRINADARCPDASGIIFYRKMVQC